MVGRLLKLKKSRNLFLFGARGTGKSTLIRVEFAGPRTLWIDLLKEEDEERYRKRPQELSAQLQNQAYDWVVIDEVQKIPKLLDRVHLEIEKKRTKFVLTGSSARKLKRGGANLLAGRASTYHLFPFSFLELGKLFRLDEALQFGTIPVLFELQNPEDKRDFLRDYVQTYLKEEILTEQIIRKVEPFRDFLEVAAQSNGQIINYKKIGDDIGVDDKTVRSYFQILEDTLVGFHLPSFHRSIRKRQRVSPKFFFFDTGIKRALEKTITLPLVPQTFAYGKAFEHRVILETSWLNSYGQLDFTLSYLRTKDNVEIDLVIERPGRPDLLVEIKSTTTVTESDVKSLKIFLKSWPKKAEAQVWSLDPNEKKIDSVECLFWTEGLKRGGFF